MKYLKIFSLLVLFPSWTAPVSAQKEVQEVTEEKVLSPKIDLFQDDRDGAIGLIFLYEGSMNAVTSVHFGVGSCEHTFTVRIKKSLQGERAIFVPDPQGRLSFDGQRLYVDKLPVNAMRVTLDDTAQGYP